MKILFVDDGRLKQDNLGEWYGTRDLTEKLWNRYLLHTDEFSVLMRKDSKVYTKEEATKNFNKIDQEKINIIVVDNFYRSIISVINPKEHIKWRRVVKKAILENDFMIIRLPSVLGGMAAKLCRKYKKRYLVEVIGCAWDSYWNHSFKAKFFAPIRHIESKIEIRHAPYVNYVSMKYLQKRYPTKGNQIYCPDVELEEPQEIILSRRIEKIKNQDSHRVTVGLIGNLSVKYRGHLILLKAVAELKKINILCKVKFLGAGDCKNWKRIAKEYGIEDRVEFCGVLPGGVPVLNWIDNIDILVMPTKAETLGRAIIEAMSRGCPVIGSEETAIGEQIGADCLCKSNDYHKIAEMIKDMISDKDYMIWCAKENFWRSFKYTSKRNDKKRNNFYYKVINEQEKYSLKKDDN